MLRTSLGRGDAGGSFAGRRSLAPGPRGPADALIKLTGVSPEIEKQLNDLGIFHFWQVAGFTPSEAAEIAYLSFCRNRLQCISTFTSNPTFCNFYRIVNMIFRSNDLFNNTDNLEISSENFSNINCLAFAGISPLSPFPL